MIRWSLMVLAGLSPAAGQPAPGKVLILHDWFGESPVATPHFVREHRERLERLPVDGLALYVRTADLEVDVSGTVFSATEVGADGMARALAPLRGLAWRRLRRNFAGVVGGEPPEFFDDWSTVVGNFGRLARAAREHGLEGVYLDNESYGRPWGDFPDGVRRPERGLAAYREQARRRGREIMAAMTAEFPSITVILLHGPYVSEPRAPEPLFPAWHASNELLGPFFAGFVEGAGPRATVVDGGELYHLRSSEEFERSYAWRKHAIAGVAVDSVSIPPPGRKAWPSRVSLGYGVYDRPFGGRPMDPATLEKTLRSALAHADRYVWLYVEGPTFLNPPEQGGAPAAWVDAVRRSR